jgi:aspartyl-tRNA(Asn)/glutamyl-tRNA(Gln) amidotransferase subunit A
MIRGAQPGWDLDDRASKDVGLTLSRREFLMFGVATSALLVWPSLGGFKGSHHSEPAEGVRWCAQKVCLTVELTQACLSRIEELNPILNAYITITADYALTRARELETERQRGRWPRPAPRDPHCLERSYRHGWDQDHRGERGVADRVPSDDASVVHRLKKAGAVILGKLNMHEVAMGVTSVQSHFGAVRNPWRLDRIADGSSGGSAAAVAAELCYGALGSDTGGSIRLPAAYCGIVGLNPSYQVA